MKTHPKIALTLCPWLLLLTQAAAAADDPIPYYIGVSQTITADTNIFRLPKTVPIKRDLVSTTALIAGLDQPLGRGKLAADIEINTNRYKNNDQLNYNGGSGHLRLDWETINRLSGDIGVYRQQTLFNPPAGSTFQGRDVVSDTGFHLGMRLGVVTFWSLEGGLGYNQTRHTNDHQALQNLNQTSGNIGVRMRPSDLWSLRLGLRETQANYPKAITNPDGSHDADKIRRHDLDLSGDWNPTGVSQLDARISYTQQKHSFAALGKKNLATGLIGYNWAPTGKTKLRLQLSRDTSVGASDRNLELISQSNGDADASNNLSLTTTWAATSKIAVQANYNYSQRKLEKTLSSSSVHSYTAHDKTNTFGLGANYNPNRHVELGCRYMHEQRSTADEATLLTSPYSVDTGMCQLKLRL